MKVNNSTGLFSASAQKPKLFVEGEIRINTIKMVIIIVAAIINCATIF
ncbi:hypothetical protein N8258_00390 [Algibacter sp.]|nr:hypothetical protein [Algibacter sp.]